MQTQKKLSQAENDLKQKNRENQESQNKIQKLTEKKNQALKDLEDARLQLQAINQQLKETDASKARIVQDNIERTEAANQAIQDRNEAVNALQRLEEVRQMMN